MPAQERHPGMLESGAGIQNDLSRNDSRILDSGLRRNDDLICLMGVLPGHAPAEHAQGPPDSNAALAWHGGREGSPSLRFAE